MAANISVSSNSDEFENTKRKTEVNTEPANVSAVKLSQNNKKTIDQLKEKLFMKVIHNWITIFLKFTISLILKKISALNALKNNHKPDDSKVSNNISLG